jgi:hypothetical protein
MATLFFGSPVFHGPAAHFIGRCQPIFCLIFEDLGVNGTSVAFKKQLTENPNKRTRFVAAATE